TPSVLVIPRSATGVTVSVSPCELFAPFKSAVSLGAEINAVFVTLPLVAVTFSFNVNVTLPPDGSVGITIPDPCMSATVVFPAVGHAAPPVALPQVMLVALRPATAGSVNTAPSPADGPALVTTTV